MQRFLLQLNRFLEQCYGDADVATGCWPPWTRGACIPQRSTVLSPICPGSWSAGRRVRDWVW